MVAGDFPVDFRTTRLGIVQTLQRVESATLRDHNTVAGLVEGPRCLERVGVRREGVLGFEASENPKRVDALAHATANREVHLAQTQHLRGVDQPHVSCRTRSPDRVGGARHAEIERRLTGGVVRDSPGVVIMRPKLRIVVKLRDVVDFVLGLDVAVLRAANVNTHTVLRHRLPNEPTVRQRLTRAVNRNTPGPRADPHLFFRLVLLGVVIAHARQLRAHVANLAALNSGHPREQISPEFGERITVGSGQTDACDDDARELH